MVPFFKMVTMPLAIRSHKLNEMLSFRPPSTKGAKPLAATVRNEELDMFTSMSLWLTLKHRETHGCVVSTVATDALVPKHQAYSIHNAD